MDGRRFLQEAPATPPDHRTEEDDVHPFIHAAASPDKAAVINARTGEALSYADLDARSNQLAQFYRREGLKAGDAVALLLDNRIEFFELAWAAQRSGLYFVCISTRLKAAEIEHIVQDSGATLLFATAKIDPQILHALRATLSCRRFVSVGGGVEGYEDYTTVRDSMPAERIADETAGADMLYSSGTTGNPKGVRLPLSGGPVEAPVPVVSLLTTLYGASADTVYLSPAPLYHAAPLRWCMGIQRLGGTVVMMESFEPLAFLEAVDRYRVTLVQMVPTMFVRLLKLPEELKERHDRSSLRCVVHAAAPCPVPVKEQMLGWWGPIIHEYYAGTEGNGYCTVSPEEWLARKGTVGRAVIGTIKICDEAGVELPPGETGTVYFADGRAFTYHNDDAKTRSSRHPVHANWSTLGDVGYVDEDGYLFLTDRKAFMIISGGVNVYPQETENLLLTHPKVADVAVFGVPDEDFGEVVKAVVQPVAWADAGPGLADELIAFARQHLSPIKAPKSIDFERELPRAPTGKLYKKQLRDRYWPQPSLSA